MSSVRYAPTYFEPNLTVEYMEAQAAEGGRWFAEIAEYRRRYDLAEQLSKSLARTCRYYARRAVRGAA